MMDALEYAKANIQEIKDRLSQIDVKTYWGLGSNYGLTEEECIAKFFNDQGLPFAPYNVEDIKALLVEPKE